MADTLSLLARIGVVLAAHVPWGRALHGAPVPSVPPDAAHATALVAVLGATIKPVPVLPAVRAGGGGAAPASPRAAPRRAPRGRAGLGRVRTGTTVGMGFPDLVALSIIVATAATLDAGGVTDIRTSAEAARAPRPVAGDLASAVFAAGIAGTGTPAVPVFGGSAACAEREAFRWPEGLDRHPREARVFHGTIALATPAGAALSSTAIDPVEALYRSAVANGVPAAPLTAVVMLVSTDPRVTGRLTPPRSVVLGGWPATLVTALVTVGSFVVG